MSIGRMLSWAVAVIAILIPFNWIRLWVIGDIPKSSTLTQFVSGTLILWAFGCGLAYFLIVSARGIKIRKAKDDQTMRELLAQPLTEIRPAQALLKSGEKAYGAVMASLQEVKTVGFSAGTTGMSVRVAKGLTIRSSGTRGRAVKGVVNVASGELVITDKRVIFAGDRKSFSILLEDLLNVTNYTDGFGFNDNRSSYTLITNNERDRAVFAITLEKVLHG
jgi:hypothetical protein